MPQEILMVEITVKRMHGKSRRNIAGKNDTERIISIETMDYLLK